MIHDCSSKVFIGSQCFNKSVYQLDYGNSMLDCKTTLYAIGGGAILVIVIVITFTAAVWKCIKMRRGKANKPDTSYITLGIPDGASRAIWNNQDGDYPNGYYNTSGREASVMSYVLLFPYQKFLIS